MDEHIQQKNWFSRNWLWVVPVGGCTTIILLVVFGISAIFFGVSSALTSSTPYEYAIERATHNIKVIEFLGEPIETAGIMQGNISLQNDFGLVDITIPLKGPNGSGTVSVKGEKFYDEWIYEELYVLIEETNKKINLLDEFFEVF